MVYGLAEAPRVDLCAHLAFEIGVHDVLDDASKLRQAHMCRVRMRPRDDLCSVTSAPKQNIGDNLAILSQTAWLKPAEVSSEIEDT